MIRQHCRYCQRQPQHTTSEWCSGFDTVLTDKGRDFCARVLARYNEERAQKRYAQSDKLRAVLDGIGVTPEGLWHSFFCRDSVFRDLFTEQRPRKHVYVTHHNCEAAK